MSFDIDIDTKTSFKPEAVFPWVRACVLKDDVLTAHPCGFYPQTIAKDPITGLAAIPYTVAEELNYFKMDFLHLSSYDTFKSRAEIERLVATEPDWTLLVSPSTHPKLFQLANHGELLVKVKPRSIIELADCMALIRPGKRQFLPLYLKNREEVRRFLYEKGEDGYSFKKSHAIAYALVVVLQLHLLTDGRLK